MINITSQNDSFFKLNGISHPRSYEAKMTGSSEELTIYPTGRDYKAIQAPIHYKKVQIEGVVQSSLANAVSKINEIVYNEGVSGSGTTTTAKIVTSVSIGSRPTSDALTLTLGSAVTHDFSETVLVEGGASQEVSWTIDDTKGTGATIDSNGLFSVSNSGALSEASVNFVNFTITATSVAVDSGGSTISESYTFRVNPATVKIFNPNWKPLFGSGSINEQFGNYPFSNNLLRLTNSPTEFATLANSNANKNSQVTFGSTYYLLWKETIHKGINIVVDALGVVSTTQGKYSTTRNRVSIDTSYFNILPIFRVYDLNVTNQSIIIVDNTSVLTEYVA